MENVAYKSAVQALYKWIMIGVVADIVAAIVGWLWVDATELILGIISGDISTYIGALLVLGILGIVSFVAIIKIFTTLGKWKNAVDANDAPAVGKLKLAYLLTIIGAIIALIPFLGFVSGILGIIASILLIIGYAGLKNSTTLPELARKGGKSLFIGAILSIVAAIVGFLPLLGWLGTIIGIVAWLLYILGWKDIANS